ncbi:MAG: SUMF1/EgtB/PvdO family nonheme iron enzyme [Myxococcota bacterium]
MTLRNVLTRFALAWALSSPAQPLHAEVVFDWVAIGEVGNACDPQPAQAICPGAVAYDYAIARFEVTNAQYAEFLNAVDPTGANLLALYDPFMGIDAAGGGIDLVSGNPAGAKYVVKTSGGFGGTGFASKPVTYIAFYDAIRFVNWLENGQGSADTESGSYTLLGGTPIPSNDTSVARNPGATIVLPDDDEWYKAAYSDPVSSGYFDDPTGTGTTTTCGPPSAFPNQANCAGPSVDGTTDVGSYPGSPSPYGTFDQGGNVYEWNETLVFEFARGIRGGAYGAPVALLAASSFDPSWPGNSPPVGGFRVASLAAAPPVPTSSNRLAPVLLVVGLLIAGVAWLRRRARVRRA